MEDEILAYYLLTNGIRNFRYVAPELLLPIYKNYKNMDDDTRKKLISSYEKNRSKLNIIFKKM